MAQKQKLLARALSCGKGNPFDLEFKLTPVLRDWIALAASVEPEHRKVILPVAVEDRPVLKLMRLNEALDHARTEACPFEVRETYERFVFLMI